MLDMYFSTERLKTVSPHFWAGFMWWWDE